MVWNECKAFLLRSLPPVAAVTGLSPDLRIDLIDPESYRPGLKVAIERDGGER